MTERSNHSEIKSPWELLFSRDSRIYLARNADLVQPSEIITKVYYVESGAVIETKTDSHDSSHVVSLCAPASIIGIPYSGDERAVYGVRATALLPSTLLVAHRDEFVEATHKNNKLTSAVLLELARRTESASRLADVFQHDSTSRHVLDLLEKVATAFRNGTNPLIAVPPQLLERMSGCPWVMVRSAISELAEKGLIIVEPDGVRLAKLITS